MDGRRGRVPTVAEDAARARRVARWSRLAVAFSMCSVVDLALLWTRQALELEPEGKGCASVALGMLLECREGSGITSGTSVRAAREVDAAGCSEVDDIESVLRMSDRELSLVRM